MNALVIQPGQDLMDEVLRFLKGNGKDFSSSLVVFPGKRPSHFLRRKLAEKVGSSFIPPVIFSMDEFVDSLCDKLKTGRKLESIDAVALLYDIHMKAPRPLGGKGFMTPDSFFPLGLKIFRDIEELTIEEISPWNVAGIESFIEEGIPEQTRERFQSLTLFYADFYRKVESLGFSTRSMRYRIAAEKMDECGLDRYGSMVFAGFFALTAAEKTLLRKLNLMGNPVFIFQDGPGLREKLKGWDLSHKSEEAAAAGPEVRFYGSPDTHGQVLALGQKLGSLRESGERPDERTVVVLPSSETLFPLVRQGLSALAEDSYNISLGYPLHRTPVFGFINNLMELVNSMDGDRVYIPDYLKFVLHPYTKNIYYRGKSETTRILLHAIDEGLLRHKAKTFTTLTDIAEDGAFFKDAVAKLPKDEKGASPESLKEHLKAIHENTVETFLAFKNIGDFAERCINLLVYIFNNSTARLHPLFYPFSESFIRALEVLPRSLMKDFAFTERPSYFSFFRKYIMTGHVPFSGTPVRGLQVLGALETRNLKFDRVFVLDANEEILPDTSREETLLPFKAREILGLPTYVDRDSLAAYYFDVLLRGAREVHLFFAESDKTERSRFVEKLLWEMQKKDRTNDPKAYIKPVQYRVKLVNSLPGPIEKTVGMGSFLKEYSFSATTLDRYLTCPLQFYYATVLGLGRKEAISGDIERDDLGSFVHDLLKNYFLSRKGKPLKTDDINIKHMDSLIEKLFEKEYGRDPSGALYLLKRQIRRHMADILRNYYIPLVSNHAVTILECEEIVEVKAGSFNLRGKIDSIEQRDDRITIVDFKTGANPNYLKINTGKLDPGRRETWGEAIGSLQLPFYLLLYAEKHREPIEQMDALFLLLGRSDTGKDMELPLFDGSPQAEMFDSMKMVIMGLLSEITDPRVPFLPPADAKKACPNCDFQYLCGTQWIMK